MNHPLASTVLSAALSLGIAAVPVAAQTSPQRTPQAPVPESQAAGPPPSDTEIHHFVDAALAVQAVDHEERPKFEAAKTDADRNKIRQEATTEMTAAVKKNELTVTRYRQILTAMQTDGQVRKKVEKEVNQRKSGR